MTACPHSIPISPTSRTQEIMENVNFQAAQIKQMKTMNNGSPFMKRTASLKLTRINTEANLSKTSFNQQSKKSINNNDAALIPSPNSFFEQQKFQNWRKLR